MRITIIYDNLAYKPGLQADWGFACLKEGGDHQRLLFDTGPQGPILLRNLQKLRFATIYLSISCPQPGGAGQVVRVTCDRATPNNPAFFSTANWPSKNKR
jgi:hypothetical protein